MTNTAPTLADILTRHADAAIEREEQARKSLARAIEAGNVLDSYTLRPVLTAQAEATPWRKVAQRIEKAGAEKALESVREEYTDLLIDRSESQSTCAITNEIDRTQRDAARRFLSATKYMK